MTAVDRRPAGRIGRVARNRPGHPAAVRSQRAARIDRGAGRSRQAGRIRVAAADIRVAVPAGTPVAVPVGIRVADLAGIRVAAADIRVGVLAGIRVAGPVGIRVADLVDTPVADPVGIRVAGPVPPASNRLCGSWAAQAADSRMAAAERRQENCPNRALTAGRCRPARPEGKTLREGIGTLRTSWLKTDILRIRRCGQQHPERYLAVTATGRRTRSAEDDTQ